MKLSLNKELYEKKNQARKCSKCKIFDREVKKCKFVESKDIKVVETKYYGPG